MSKNQVIIVAVILAAVFRVLRPELFGSEFLPNVAPVAALGFLAAFYANSRWAWVCAAIAIAISDLVLYRNLHQPGLTDAFRYLAYGATALLGWKFAKRRCWAALASGSVIASTGFYLLTNTGVWLTGTMYDISLAGWMQANTTGISGFMPAWCFWRNALLGDLTFIALSVFLVDLSRKESTPMWVPANV